MPNDRFWRGTSGDWNSTSNWSATRYGSTGASVPTSNDSAFLLDPVQYGPTTNLSQGSVDLNYLYVGPDYDKDIGAPGSPLTIAVSGTTGSTFRFAGSGKCYITAGTNGIDRAVATPRGAGKVYMTGGTTAQFENKAGDNEFSSGSTVTTAYNFARLNVAQGSALTTLENESGGTAAVEVNTTTINNDAGATCTVKLSATVTTLNNRGTYAHASNGTITTANCRAGSRATASAPFTVTTLNKHAGSYAWDEEPVTVTKPTTNTIGF